MAKLTKDERKELELLLCYYMSLDYNKQELLIIKGLTKLLRIKNVRIK